MAEPMILLFHPQAEVGRRLAGYLAETEYTWRLAYDANLMLSELMRYDPQVVLLPPQLPGLREPLPQIIAQLAPRARQVALVQPEEVGRFAADAISSQLTLEPFPAPEETLRAVAAAVGAAEVAATVLVVGDRGLHRARVADVLHDQSYRVLRASNADEGLDLARTMAPDAVLIDGELPGRSGLDAVRALKADPQTELLPVAMLLPADSERTMRQALDAGAIECMATPLLPRALIGTVDRMLSRQPALAYT